MNINLLPYAVFWGVLAIVVVFLIIYRKQVSSREDDSLHLAGSGPADQIALAHRLERRRFAPLGGQRASGPDSPGPQVGVDRSMGQNADDYCGGVRRGAGSHLPVSDLEHRSNLLTGSRKSGVQEAARF